MQGNGEQKGGLKNRIKTWFLIRKKKKRKKKLEKQEKLEKERQLKIKNSQVFSNQNIKTYSKKETFARVSLGFFLALFEPHTIKKEEREKNRFLKQGLETPAAFIEFKIDTKKYTESLGKSLELVQKEIDTMTTLEEKDRIKQMLLEKQEGLEQVKGKYDKVKEKHQLKEKTTLLGLSKSREVIVDGKYDNVSKQSLLASTAFITGALETSEEKLNQVMKEFEVKEIELDEKFGKNEMLNHRKTLNSGTVVATIHTNTNEKIDLKGNQPISKKHGIGREKEAVEFLKKQTKKMKKNEARIDEIDSLILKEENLEVLNGYLKELDTMYETLNASLLDYKKCQEKYGMRHLVAFEDIRNLDSYRLCASDLKIREIMRHTNLGKGHVEDRIKYVKANEEEIEKKKLEEKEKEEQQKKQESVVEKEPAQLKEMQQAAANMKKLLEEQINYLNNFHGTLQKSSKRVRKENHFRRLKGMIGGFLSMAVGAFATIQFKNPVMKFLTAGFALNSTVKNLRKAIHPEVNVEMIPFEEILQGLESQSDALEKAIDLYHSTLTEIEWLQNEFEQEFKAYEFIFPEEYQKAKYEIDGLRSYAKGNLKELEKEKQMTKQEKQKVLTLGGKS